MSDLVEQLRAVHAVRRDQTPLSAVIELCHKAADEIERLRAECEHLRKRLEVEGHHSDIEIDVLQTTIQGLRNKMEDMSAECEGLRLECDALEKLCIERFDTIAELGAECEGLRSDFAALQHAIVCNTGASAILSVDALRKDAERYRWLRAGNYPLSFAQAVLNDTPHGIDAAIDEAMK